MLTKQDGVVVLQPKDFPYVVSAAAALFPYWKRNAVVTTDGKLTRPIGRKIHPEFRTFTVSNNLILLPALFVMYVCCVV